MSTRSFLVRELEPGCKYEYIYCHHDSYLEDVGKTLVNCYRDPEAVEALFALGDLSGLGDTPTDGTDAYHRDRGEPWEDVAPQQVDDLGEIEDQEYIYIYRDGVWFYKHWRTKGEIKEVPR